VWTPSRSSRATSRASQVQGPTTNLPGDDVDLSHET
jgi:hypothetical protein